MKTVYFRLVLGTLAGLAAAAGQSFPQYAAILNLAAAALTGLATPAEALQKVVMLAPKAASALLLVGLFGLTASCGAGLPDLKDALKPTESEQDCLKVSAVYHIAKLAKEYGKRDFPMSCDELEELGVKVGPKCNLTFACPFGSDARVDAGGE